MQTVTLKMEKRHVDLLEDLAKTRGVSKAEVVRDLIDRHLKRKGRVSLHERSKDLCGYFSGSRDLSTRKLKGYGRD